ncbi:hypothetical protein [Thomasclavelia spiroformis]|uniref:hypothetical protein n=1 Tax=Thomasclavelia spiroformis TaxID=29348 RepID=UPI0024B04D24|nr:hypothetical protein [Thomasclavelia spiroformis]
MLQKKDIKILDGLLLIKLCKKICRLCDNDEQFKWVEFEDGLEVDFVQNSFFPPTKIVNQYIAKIMDQYKNKKIKWH